MKAKILLPLATTIMFLGCSFFEDNPPVRKQPRQVMQNTPAKSSIKGFIKEVTYKDSNRYYYDKGDLVYATFYADKLIDMLLVKEGGSSGLYNGIKKPQNEVVIKRKNVKTNIEVPKEEKISF